MDDFPTSIRGHTPEPREADQQSIDSDVQDIYAVNDNPNQIVTYAPKQRFRLGYFDCICLVVNFMIGTGVFQSHTTVMQGTDSTGAALMLWTVGIIYCLCGTHVYIEYGLNVPRYTINGVEQSVPRSGGDLNYLQYVYRKPAYRKNTIQLSTCLFGIGFIAFGNMAGNAINFAVRLLRAAGYEEPNNGAVRGIAIAVATLTCFIHAFSRRGGIWLNNMFAIVKLGILLLIVITAIVVGAGGLPKAKNVIDANTSTSTSFEAENTDANGYARAFLAVIFTFWGFEQPNYIMGEISRPKRKFPISMGIGVALICILYMAVTLSYMVVVPKDVQIHGKGGVAQHFFELSLGQVGGGDTGKRIFNAFLAISSVGNMIVMTYTAARVKQEVAKEGILPYPKFFAQNSDLSLGRLLKWMQNKGWSGSLLQRDWLKPEHHSEKTPVGAFVLHFLSCLILIFATWGMTPDDAYNLLTTLSVYVINCFFGFFVGLGILILRFKGPPPTASADADHHDEPTAQPLTWNNMAGRKINPVLSVVTATIFTVCNAWPVITTWVPPKAAMKDGLAWWLIPTIAWAVIVFGIAWFLGFLSVAHSINHRDHKVFVVEKKPEFESDDSNMKDGGLVLIHETTYLSWVGKETLPAGRHGDLTFGETAEHQHVVGSGNHAESDFEPYFRDMHQQQTQHMGGFDGHHHHHASHSQQPSPIPPQNQFHQTTPPFPQAGFQHPHQPPRAHYGSYRH